MAPAARRQPARADFLPTTPADLAARGWDWVDVVFVSGDAYVDHPSFANAILGRALEHAGFRVAMLCQPDWKSAEAWRIFGRPRLFFAVSAGNMDSMLNRYTHARKPRGEDAYSPGGAPGLRPDRATLAYCQRAREAFRDVPIIAGGIEASLRRFAHYDFWSDTVRKSLFLDAKPDLLVYGMGEAAIVEIARALDSGGVVKDLRAMPGVVYALGRREHVPADIELLPSYEEVKASPDALLKATTKIQREHNPWIARRLGQWHADRLLVQNPPRPPLSQQQLDAVYDLPFTRLAHPDYAAPVPAYEVVRHSVVAMRGCFGGCSFCSITAHEGRTVQSRSERSLLAEVERVTRMPDFTGTISDIGGPTANMYRQRCTAPDIERQCRRVSCVHPNICRHLDTSHEDLRALLAKARAVPGVQRVLVASGVRMDLALRDPEYIRDLALHHTGGHLKVAPEHIDDETLRLMKKPDRPSYEEFSRLFERFSRQAGKRQYLVPYFIAAFPGAGLKVMVELALYLKRRGLRPRQVQDFLPAPGDAATAMFVAAKDPATKKALEVARHPSQRRQHRALLQYFLPENADLVREALREAGREDLIGHGPDCLVAPRAHM